MAEQPAMSGQLTVAVAVHAAVALLQVSGELDLDTAPEIDAAVQAALLGHPRIMILDAGALTFCDCAGLGALLRARQRITGLDATFHLENPHPQLVRLAAITGTCAALGLPAPVPEPRQEQPPIHAATVGAGR